MSEQFDPFSLGYGETVEQQTTEESPTLSITVKYFFASERRQVRVPWTQGLTVQRAFHTAKRMDSIFRLVGVNAFARVVGNRRVRLHETLRAGDEIRLNPIAKPFL